MNYLVLLAAGGAAANSLPRGVGPEFASHFSGSSSFACIHSSPSKAINLSQVNDNTCDCADGSDEPGTSACSYLNPLSPPQPFPGSSTGSTNTTNTLPGFWCENSGHMGAYVPFTWVNDGVCDYHVCCDGSEEYGGAGGVRCENRCDEIGREYARLKDERVRAAERSARARAELAAKARELRGQVQHKVASLREEIRLLEIKTMDLQQKYEQTEQEERGKVAGGAGGGGKLGVLLGLAKTRVEELRSAVASVVNERDGLKTRVADLEEMLSKFKEEHNPNFNDDGVKRAVKAWEEYAAKQAAEARVPEVAEEDVMAIMEPDGDKTGINWVEFEQEAVPTDTDILYTLEAYLPPFARAYMQSRVKVLRVWLIRNGMLADSPKGAESRVVAAAREAYESSTRDLASSKKSLDEQERDLVQDYGHDGIFRALKGKCIDIESGEYTYELCWLDKTSQKPRRGGGATTMGKFDRIDVEEADEEARLDGKGLGTGKRLVLRYDKGQSCWNGPQRRTDVWLACSEKEEVWRVSEAEKCVYRMEVGTPAACESLMVVGPKDERPGKDEL